MGKRKNKSTKARLLSSTGSFLLIGSFIYILVAGFNLFVGAAMAAAIFSLGVPSVEAGESFFEVVTGFFEAFFDGVMEVVSGILDAISSIFN